MPDHYEQMWTRTQDKRHVELCSIPFFTYGLSLGDVITLTSDEGLIASSRRAVIALLSPHATAGVLVWEWADPVVPD